MLSSEPIVTFAVVEWVYIISRLEACAPTVSNEENSQTVGTGTRTVVNQ
jgi:hypothetical protein